MSNNASQAIPAHEAIARTRQPGLARLSLAALTAAWLLVEGSTAWAQKDSGNGKTGTFDQSKLKSRTMEKLRDKLEVKDDAEWNIIQMRVENIMQAQRELQSALVAAQRKLQSRRSSGKESVTEGVDASRRAAEGDLESEMRALQKLVDTRASAQEVKHRVARVRDLLRARQERLTNAREDLRAVLSSRQEAIAILTGLLR